MVVQHNIPAINSHRNLLVNNSATAKNLEKLSSGYRINRAGDDAAGLAISEKMRGQIRGLAMAEQNTNNAISLVQTAEGGLNETHAILQRMRELAVQASNGTYDDAVDRANLDLEVERLKSEIDRISTSTNYNGIELLNGSMSSTGIAGGKLTGTTTLWSTAPGFGVGTGTATGNINADFTITYNRDGTYDFSGGVTNVSEAAGVYTLTLTGGGTFAFTPAFGASPPVAGNTYQMQIHMEATGGTISGANSNWDIATYSAGQAVTFQIGANGTADQQVGLEINNMASYAIGSGAGNQISNISIGNQTNANAAIAVITDATNQVSRQRAELGALQNRLEHTLNNLGVTKENLTAAESVIRDVDMAKEMMEFTKNNILVQASQAMLAQANMLPQGILSLLS